MTVGPGVSPDHALWSQEARFRKLQEQALELHTARGLYHRSGITPCPEGFIWLLPLDAALHEIITQLRFDDALDRANRLALG